MIGKVIKIPDETTIIISHKEQNLIVGNKIAVYDPMSKIIDPDTKEVLGTYDFIKERLEIIEIYPKYAICRKYTKPVTTMRALAPILEGLMVKNHEDMILNVNPKDNESLLPRNTIINIGDPIKKINE